MSNFPCPSGLSRRAGALPGYSPCHRHRLCRNGAETKSDRLFADWFNTPSRFHHQTLALFSRLFPYRAGRRELPTIHIQAFEKNIKEIERFCAKVDNLELPLMQAVEKVLGSGQ